MAKAVLRTITTVEAISNMLEEDIYSLQYKMGEKLTEAELAARYGVSRNTLREAMTYLTSKGLLERVTNKGIYVKDILADDVAEIFHLRELLEREAVRQIISSGVVPPKLHELAYEVSRYDLDTDSEANLNADIVFHTYLVEAAGSPRLINMYQTLLYEVKLCIFQSCAFVPPRPENVQTHYQLLQAMQAGDLVSALSYLREHIASAIQAYQKGLLSRI